MTPLVVIPARLAATRLPDKPLADIHGVPMIVHVYGAAPSKPASVPSSWPVAMRRFWRRSKPPAVTAC